MSAPPTSEGLGTRAKTRPPLRPDDGRLARGRRSRARIREAARSLFRERGFDGATLRAIAERAGMGLSAKRKRGRVTMRISPRLRFGLREMCNFKNHNAGHAVVLRRFIE